MGPFDRPADRREVKTELSRRPILVKQRGRDLPQGRPWPKLTKDGTGVGIDACAAHDHPLPFAERADNQSNNSLVHDTVDDREARASLAADERRRHVELEAELRRGGLRELPIRDAFGQKDEATVRFEHRWGDIEHPEAAPAGPASNTGNATEIRAGHHL
jgi:hypothetical protein